MASRSKFSSICWNTSIKSQRASSNFEGVVQAGWSRLVLIHLLFLLQCWYLTYHLVQLWDATRSQSLSEMVEQERRVWSIDFSSADPQCWQAGAMMVLSSYGVSIRELVLVSSKQRLMYSVFSFPCIGRFLAFGSADHRIYYHDLRNLKMPLCTFFGHDKTVSYIKFVDRVNLVSASTDNTLKLWDFSACTSQVIDTPPQTFTGDVNGKNFVGLSVSDEFIATGSETNEVFIYHKVFPMPAMSFKFQNTPIFWA